MERLNLAMHDGGSGGDGGGSAGIAVAETSGTPAATNAGQPKPPEPKRQVLYGKQPSQETVTAGAMPEDGQQPAAEDSQSRPDKKAAWKQLIDGEYKEEFGQAVKQAIERRFKQVKPMEERLEQLDPLVDMLASRYGIAANEPAKIMEALEADNAYWEEAANEAGMTVEQYRHMQRLQRENARFQADLQRQAAEKKAQEQVALWQQQAVELQQFYPQFDLRHECENPQFVKMLAHVPMKTAYEALHMGEIMQGAMAQTARAVEKGVTENIRAKGQRPQEAGLNSTPGVEIKNDPSRLTRADRKRIRELVAKGEKISF